MYQTTFLGGMGSFWELPTEKGGHVIPHFKSLSVWELKGASEEDFDMKGLKEF